MSPINKIKRKVGLAKLCKYDEIGKIPSGNLHPIPRAQSQSGSWLEAAAENPIRPSSCRPPHSRPRSASIKACTTFNHQITLTVPSNASYLGWQVAMLIHTESEGGGGGQQQRGVSGQ